MMDTQVATAPVLQRSRLLLSYILIAYIISWVIEIPLALDAQGVISTGLPFAIHYLAAFGPFVAGIVLTWREGGSDGLKNLLQRALKWRVHPVWWIVALSPVLLFVAVALIRYAVQGVPLDFSMLTHFDFLPDIGLAVILVWLATYGVGEEIGWRGYLLARLQRGYKAGTATLVLWAIWALWHAPSFFYLHTAPSAGMLIGFLVGVLAGAIFLTWLYNSSGGSVLIVAVWHGLFDYVTACTECKSGLIAAIISTLVMVWAVAIIFLYKLTDLSPKPRQTA